MICQSGKVLLAIGFVLALTQCKTPGTSVTKGEGDVQDGLNINQGDAQARTRWAFRMGIRFADDATVAAVVPAQFAQSVGIAPGDIVLALNGQTVRNEANFEQIAQTFVGLGKAAPKWDGVWVVKIRRGAKEFDMQAHKTYDCDPYVLVGCGPLNE